ncbi:MAG: tryptophan synthase subunit beta like protein [Halieaceae bacterium]|nr:tryptophan synthase subunit beta like protein [Halieaceae bacterium]
MPFVKRNGVGEIEAIATHASTDFSEQLQSDDPEVIAFTSAVTQDSQSLSDTDQDFVRVLEDVVELLIAKGVILFTDLPESAQTKMLHRQKLRAEAGRRLNLIGDD